MQKQSPPRIIRPPAPHGPEVPCAPGKPLTANLRGTGGGLLGSLAIHLFLIAAAWSITLISPEPGCGSDGIGTADSEGFEMSVMPATPSASLAEDPPQSSSQPPHPTLSLSEVSTIKLPVTLQMPPVESMTLASSDKPLESIAETGQASQNNGQGIHAGKAGPKGSGQGHLAGHTHPSAPPKLLHAPPPKYPAAAKAAKISGQVAVLIRVKSDGSTASTGIYHSCGNRLLDQAAVDAAKSWTFSPTPSLASHTTIPVVVHVTFSL